jgi:hypothetical protein
MKSCEVFKFRSHNESKLIAIFMHKTSRSSYNRYARLEYRSSWRSPTCRWRQEVPLKRLLLLHYITLHSKDGTFHTHCRDSFKSHTLYSYFEMTRLLHSTAQRPRSLHYCTRCYSAHLTGLNVSQLHIRLHTLYSIVIKDILWTSLYTTMENYQYQI